MVQHVVRMSATECHPDVWVPLTFMFWVRGSSIFLCWGFWDNGILTYFYSQITSDGSRFYVPSASFNLGKLFYSPNRAKIHTVLEHEFKTELYYINSSINFNFYLYMFFPENSCQWKMTENVTKSSVMIEILFNIYIGLICIKKWQESSIAI